MFLLDVKTFEISINMIIISFLLSDEFLIFFYKKKNNSDKTKTNP